MYILKLQEKINKNCLVLKINALELVAVNSALYGENTWHARSMG